MSSIQQFRDNPFWAWAIISLDVDSELAKAMKLYRQRYGRAPHLLFCAADVEPQPVTGLQIGLFS